MPLNSKVVNYVPESDAKSYPAIFKYKCGNQPPAYVLVPKRNGSGINLVEGAGSLVGGRWADRDWDNSAFTTRVTDVTIQFKVD